jgi:hypothetical protein
MPPKTWAFHGLVVLLAVSSFVSAESITITPVADTTLFQNIPGNNLGAEPTLISGSNANLKTNRALLKFDIAANLPPNATIQSVSLDLTVVKTLTPDAYSFSLHRVMRDWGEGTGVSPTSGTDGGSVGSPALNGEATWLARFHPDVLWSLPGAAAPADYAADVSGNQNVGGEGVFTFSSASLASDAQSWLTNSASNYGWILVCDDEAIAASAHRFASREDEANAARLTIEYTTPTRPHVTLLPVADTTLFEYAPDNNLGGGSLVAGSIGLGGSGKRSRAVIQFSMTNLPADAAILTSATLRLVVIKLPGFGVASIFDLHRVLSSWGEGNQGGFVSDGGPATAGQASWNFRFFKTNAWATPGGAAGTDFVASVSSSTFISGSSSYAFPDLLPDVQFWRANPEQNFGWMLMTEAEGTPYTARRFGSREESGVEPALDIEYIPQPRIERGEIAGGLFNLSFLAQAGQAYAVQSSDSFLSGSWSTITNVPPPALIQTVDIQAPLAASPRFYRVIIP